MKGREHADHAHDARRREQVFNHWQAEILREARDDATLQRVLSRAIADPEVARDSELASMVRGCAAHVAQDLAARRAAESVTADAERAAFSPAPPKSEPGADAARTPASANRAAAARSNIAERFVHLEHDFRDHVARLNESAARAALKLLYALLQSEPAAVDADRLAECEKALEEMLDQRADLEQTVQRLVERGTRAAAHGDTGAAARCLQRLSTIHAAHPFVLPDERLLQLRDQIVHATEEHEHRLAAEELVRRERVVAAELKELADQVHNFHDASRRLPHDSPEFARAEQEYHRAVRAVQSHDNDWLAALILELMDLLEEWHESSHRGEHQVDRFLDSVRSALHTLRREIAQIEKEGGRRGTPGNP